MAAWKIPQIRISFHNTSVYVVVILYLKISEKSWKGHEKVMEFLSHKVLDILILHVCMLVQLNIYSLWDSTDVG